MGNLALSIAASGVTAQQTAMDTVAQNLANSNTPGYVQETPTLTAAAGLSPLGVGLGVTPLASGQAYDGLLQTSAQQASAALAQSGALQQVLQGIQTGFPVSTTTGLNADLSAFWQSWDTVAQKPSDSGARSQVINLASNLISDLHTSSAAIATSQGNAQQQLSALVSADNSVLTQLAQLNTAIITTKAAGSSANSLIDQQSQLMNQLSQDLGAVSSLQPNGTINVSIGGVNVVAGVTASQLQLTGTAGSLGVQTTTGTAVTMTSGSAAGTLAAINQYLPDYQSQLDGVANDLATTVNTQLAAGYTASGAPGGPLFTIGSGAASIGLVAAVAADPSLLAASGTATLPDAANNGANAQSMANLYDASSGPDTAYRSFVQTMGTQISALNSQVQTQTSVANAAQANLQAVSGVNVNSQMVMMLNYQQSYQASAKVISAVDQMMQSLLQAT
ncbi:flagellar hook-associated protein FlgK [Acidiferrimicrobium sp. IK]|uniref:flagellar hook-associated protein FlgK n=1 Tax=Acidiferrimicrobium sp. IK TaxID=2871700 RepID=UPI0021CB4057|nr:flagellar hook-associated protein FlgK [Acidiferrimicrobium sp. IK]MCU4185045.1 flagellar hook-associated protein FlgK [Acidiferrimicrobium sp. IK]